MSDTLPLFRADINVALHHEGGETYLILSDVNGYAEGPIMVQADMVVILEACDGLTTWSAFAASQSLDVDSSEILRARGFVAQLSTMGYFDDHHYAQRRAHLDAEWHALDVRPMVCADVSYPRNTEAFGDLAGDLAGDLKETLRETLQGTSRDSVKDPSGLLQVSRSVSDSTHRLPRRPFCLRPCVCAHW